MELAARCWRCKTTLSAEIDPHEWQSFRPVSWACECGAVNVAQREPETKRKKRHKTITTRWGRFDAQRVEMLPGCFEMGKRR